MTKRRRAGRQRRVAAPRHPSGEVKRDRDRSLPPPEVMARRGLHWKDQDAGDIFGIMQARKLLPDRSDEKVNNKPGPTPRELKVAGQGYATLVAQYERYIGAPVCATPRSGGRTVASEDVELYRSVVGQVAAVRASLRDLDHRCTIALARAAAATTHEQIEAALELASWIVPALIKLHDAADDIRRAGRLAVDNWRVKEAA